MRTKSRGLHRGRVLCARRPVKKTVLHQYRDKRRREGRGFESASYLPVHPHQEDAPKHEPSEETRRDVARVRAPVSLVLHVGHAPAADGDLRADVYEREDRQQMKLLDAQHLLVLVRGDGLRVWADACLRQDLCLGWNQRASTTH